MDATVEAVVRQLDALACAKASTANGQEYPAEALLLLAAGKVMARRSEDMAQGRMLTAAGCTLLGEIVATELAMKLLR